MPRDPEVRCEPDRRRSGLIGALERLVAPIDRWQRTNRVAGPTWAVVRKFSDDNANLLVVALGWYGFTAIYPLMLVLVAVLGYIGAPSLGTSTVHTLHQFPVIGAELNPGPGASRLHGSAIGVVAGVAGLLYAARGVTSIAEEAMARVWNQTRDQMPGFLDRLGRSLAALGTIGGAFVANAALASIATGYGHRVPQRIGLVVAMLVLNVGAYLSTFVILTTVDVPARTLLPGALTGGVGFTALITVGAGLVEHQLRHSSATYGALSAVLGVVAFLLLLAKMSLYAAELNPILARGLWPRALPMGEPSEADRAAAKARV